MVKELKFIKGFDNYYDLEEFINGGKIINHHEDVEEEGEYPDWVTFHEETTIIKKGGKLYQIDEFYESNIDFSVFNYHTDVYEIIE